MADATIYGVPNHGLNPANTWTSGTTIAGFPASNLGLASLSDKTILYPTPAQSWVRLAIAAGQYHEVGGVAVVLTNLWKSATRNEDTGAVSTNVSWRVRMSRSDFKPLAYPDAIAASSNLTGAVAAVQDDPYNPDSSWLTATTPGTATNARFTFPALGGLNLTAGASLQAFLLRVRKTAAGSGNPVLTVELYEGGSLKATLSPSKTTGFTSVAVGEPVTVFYNASSLSDATGASLEVRLSGTGTSGTSLEFGAVEAVNAFDFTGTADHDSGLLPLYLPNTLGVLPCNLYYLLPSTITPDYVQIDFTDPSNPDGFIQVGLPIIGPRYTFGVNNVTPGAEWALETDTLKGRTVGGATRADVRKMRRAFHGTWENLTDTHAYDSFFDRLGMACGTTGGFVLIFDPDTPTRYPHTAGYGVMNQPPRIVHPYSDGRVFALDFSEEVA